MAQVELLAPAGNFEIFETVIHAGADAVYLAGSQYGARAYAGNLSEEELLKAIEECHVYGKKLYLTVNTLCKESELQGLYDYILPLYEAGLSGVIVQDVGVLAYLHAHFPGLELHASTQMTITNTDFIPFLKRYGVTRIVPARELSLEEIRKLHEESGMEIESFVHGALCYCYSGDCFMSSFMGGRSGNRGRCAQPCRLSFMKDGKTKNLLSLKDLRTIDILPDLIEHGVYSMKIEGRMKSAEYAAGITEIYRKYIDLYLAGGREGYRVDSKDVENLLLLFDRGGTTTGYYTRHNSAKMIADESKSDKSQEEKRIYEEGVLMRNQRGDYRLPVSAYLSVRIGEPSVLVLSMEERNLSVSVTGACAEPAMKRAMTQEDIAKQIRKTGDSYYRIDELICEMDDNLFITNGALNELRREAITQLTAMITQEYRRDGQSIAVTNHTEPEYQTEKNDTVSYQSEHERSTNQGYSIHCLKKEQAQAVLDRYHEHMRLILETELMTASELIELIKRANSLAVPVYIGGPRIMRDGYDSFFTKIAEELVPQVDGFLVRSIGQLAYIAKKYPTKQIITDYTCYGFNQLASDEISSYSDHIISQTYSIESNQHEMRGLHPVNPELWVYGRVPLMTTANCVDLSTSGCHKPNERMAEIVDRKNAKLPVLTCCRYCYNLIYNSVPIYLADKERELNAISIAHYGIHFTTETSDETLYMMDLIVNGTAYTSGEFTRGHFQKGVE